LQDDGAGHRLRRARFFTSPYAQDLDGDARDLLDLLLWFGCDYGPGDPLRWSNVAIEVFLLDFLPRKYGGPGGDLDGIPSLLRAFVRFCHAERGLRPALTAETLAAVDEFEVEFRSQLREPRPGLVGWWHALHAPHDGFDLELTGAEDDVDINELMRETLVRAVGDEHALETLDDAPLPDEAFDWSGIPADVRGAVEAVVDRCDGCCDSLFDVEMRTACRRVLARVASGDPNVFRRKGKPETAAAAVCWITAKANERLSYHGLTATELGEWFGVGSNPGARAHTLLKAGGWQPQRYRWMDLASPAYLTGPRRRRLIELRKRYRG
jgi:hypothetical protein